MNILLVDDEALLLAKLKSCAEAVIPEANLFPFSKASEAMEFAKTTKFEIAFLDINMRTISGIDMAVKLQELYPTINIIFCTGYSEYSMDALNLHCSGYILKPVTEEKMLDAIKHLRHPVEEKAGEPKDHPKVKIQCFGNFDALIDGVSIKFKYEKTRELLAYLVDRRGSICTNAEISAVLWEEDDHSSYLKSLRKDLVHTLEDLGCGDILDKQWGKLAIIPDRVECDYFDWCKNKEGYREHVFEYMSQYSWAEYVNAQIANELSDY